MSYFSGLWWQILTPFLCSVCSDVNVRQSPVASHMNGNKCLNRCNRSDNFSGSNVSNTRKGSTSSSSSINFTSCYQLYQLQQLQRFQQGTEKLHCRKHELKDRSNMKLQNKSVTFRGSQNIKKYVVCCFLFSVTLKWTHGSRVVWLLNTPAGASMQEEFKRVVWRFPSTPWSEQPLREPAGGCCLALKSSRISSHTLRFFTYYSRWNFRVNLRIFHCSFKQHACDYQSPTDQ